MKRTQREIDQTYRSPNPGELNKRVTFRTRLDTPGADSGLVPTFPSEFDAWAKIRQVSGSAYKNSVQIGEKITHTITIRKRPVNNDMEVLCGDAVYRVQRVLDLNNEGRFTYIEVTELGPDTAPSESTFYGGYGGT
ncbi:phage head closure protein [Rahnella aceris]|uniref:phage head closure protein n=1 Tax=Rahnella sp. (strain Y9602) TaxID=2703885 RepID=UPI001C270155|nr:phage head closure protein [Rahnella aceris]MBU9866813.1 phage head closure protein [Rahnella aceris]